MDAPADLVQVVKNPSLTKTQELMRQVDLILATGGAAMAKAAYSSGTPAYGVGVGNTVHIADETANVTDMANCVATAKTFDYATSCLADNAIVIHSSIYSTLVDLLVAKGGYICNAQEKDQLQCSMWTDVNHAIPSNHIIAKSVHVIAQQAGISVPESCTFLIVEEQHAGQDYPFSGEKLSSVLTLYRYEGGIENAITLVNSITDYQGRGHTCGIHSENEANIMAVALGTKTARVMVNQNLNEGAGSLRNGLPYTLSLSCGTWGGNITTENINARHLINVTWVARPITPRILDETLLFGQHWEKYGH